LYILVPPPSYSHSRSSGDNSIFLNSSHCILDIYYTVDRE
jgi:hypothetical protein